MLLTLGKLALENNALTRPKTLSLLAYLALEGRKHRTHARQLLWGTASDAAASLRIALQQLRTAGALLEEQKHLTCAMTCDAALLLEKLDRGDQAAVELYTGEFLAGVQFDSAEFEEWVLITREHIATRVCQAYLHLAQAALEQADLPKAAQQAVAAYTLSKTTPLETEDVLTLLGIFEDCSHDLAATLRQELLDLKISIPNRNKVTVRHLPSAISGFVFRSEQAALEKLLQDQRLITIVGYGGAGKSRLALEVLRALPETSSPFFVPLEPILEPADVIPACLRAMSYRESSSNPLEQLQSQIGQKNVVLLLDNAEHLISVGTMLETLLESCPNLRILLTSRERLGVLGETVFPLGGFADDESALELLDLACRRTGTVFTWQTKTALKICDALERFPLAIELAAAMIGVLPLTEILEALQQHLDALETSHGRERHRSMRAVFNWSWSLLSNPQRQGLMRLAVFRDGFSRVAALQVMGSNLTVIAALVSKSLVQNQQNGRYRLHPLIAQYSLEALEGIPKEARNAKAAHAEVFLSWLEQNAPLVRTAQAGVVLGAFETDLENIKSAWGWLCEHPDLGRFDRLQDLVSLFDARARFEEGVQLFFAANSALSSRNVLEFGTLTLSTQVLAGIKNSLAFLLHRMKRRDEALAMVVQAKSLLDNIEPTELHLKNLNTMSIISEMFSPLESQLELYAQAAALAEKLNLPYRQALTMNNLGRLQVKMGNYEAGIKNLRQAIQQYTVFGDTRGALFAILTLSYPLVFGSEQSSEETEKLLLDLLENAKVLKEDFLTQQADVQLLFYYLQTKQLSMAEKSISHIKKNLTFYDKHHKILFCIAKGIWSKNKNDFSKAKNYLTEAILQSNENTQELFYALFEYGDILQQEDKIESTREILTYLRSFRNINRWHYDKLQRFLHANQHIQELEFLRPDWLTQFKDHMLEGRANPLKLFLVD